MIKLFLFSTWSILLLAGGVSGGWWVRDKADPLVEAYEKAGSIAAVWGGWNE